MILILIVYKEIIASEEINKDIINSNNYQLVPYEKVKKYLLTCTGYRHSMKNNQKSFMTFPINTIFDIHT